MRTLIFDISITGHHTEYISHLINYLYNNKDTNEYFFVVHSNFSSEFPFISSKAKSIKNINWVEIESEELQSLQHLGMVKKSFIEFRLMHRYALKFNVNHVCLLYFNTFQLALAFYRPSYTISGILFSQFYRMNKDTFIKKLTYYRKYLVTKIYSFNPKIKSVFVLNDYKSVLYLNNEFNTTIFKMLPDPIPELQHLHDFNIYKYYNIEIGQKIFLHIGSLGERKGTYEVIDSALHFSKEKQQEVAILLVGRATNKESEQLIMDKIGESCKNSKISIIWDNKFISNELMKSLFEQSYAVLMPYKNTTASSGILGHAAASNKMVIATGKGLLKELVIENNLGLLIDKVSPKIIADAITKSLNYNVDSSGINNFLLQHKVSSFVEKLLNN